MAYLLNRNNNKIFRLAIATIKTKIIILDNEDDMQAPKK